MTISGPDDDTLLRAAVATPAEVLTQELPEEELIFLDLRNETYFGLDAMGTRMYRAVVEAESVEAAFERLQHRFQVEPERLRADLVTFVRRLMERGLLEPRA